MPNLLNEIEVVLRDDTQGRRVFDVEVLEGGTILIGLLHDSSGSGGGYDYIACVVDRAAIDPLIQALQAVKEVLPQPSFKAETGRDPQPGVDYDPDAGLCQDDYEHLTGTGAYSDGA